VIGKFVIRDIVLRKRPVQGLYLDVRRKNLVELDSDLGNDHLEVGENRQISMKSERVGRQKNLHEMADDLGILPLGTSEILHIVLLMNPCEAADSVGSCAMNYIA
jgi:hypothetical protein